jgi:hypothetical protein
VAFSKRRADCAPPLIADVRHHIARVMDSQDLPVAHFELMRELASSLKQLPAQLLDHSYSYEGFGSWSLILRFKGRALRCSFDGRDHIITLEQSATRKAPYDWNQQLWVSPPLEGTTLIADICDALLQSETLKR